MTQIKLRRDTAANWATANAVLAQGEPAIDTTTNGLKLGDGNTAWTDLPYLAGGFPTPSITYTGTFGGEPSQWLFTEPKKILYTSNNTIHETDRYLWLDQRFDDQYYDLSALESISFNNIGGITDYLDFSDKSEFALESIDFGQLAFVQGSFYLSGFGGVINSITANNLSYIADSFDMYSNGFTDGPNLEFPALEIIGDQLYLDYNNENNGLANTVAPSFPALKRVDSSVYIYNNTFLSYPEFTSLEYVDWEFAFHNNWGYEGDYSGPGLPALITLNYLTYYSNDNMTSVPEFTNLTTIRQWLNMYNNQHLTSFPSFPALTHIQYGGINGYNCTSMTSVGTFLPSVVQIGSDVNFQNCALDQESIDAILVKLASLDGTGGTTSYDSRTITLNNGTNAYPSVTGLAAISTLEGRGCTVYYNTP